MQIPVEAKKWELDLGKPDYKRVSSTVKITILHQRLARLMNKNLRRMANGLPPKMKYAEI